MHKQFYFYSLSNKSEIRWLQLCRFLCREEKKKYWVQNRGFWFGLGFFFFVNLPGNSFTGIKDCELILK